MSNLTGKRIVNTRAVHQAGELDYLLRDRGAVPLAYPCIAIEPPADTTAVDIALADLCNGAFDWLTLTSANTVHALAKRAGRLPSAPTARVAVVGPGTAEAAARELGLRADVMPSTYRAADLATAMPIEPGQRVLIPQSEIASPDLANGLRAQGAEVITVTAYRTVTGSGGVDLPALLTRNEIDAVILASSSAVDGFFARLAAEGGGIDQTSTGVQPKLVVPPRQTLTAPPVGFSRLPESSPGLQSGAAPTATQDFGRAVTLTPNPSPVHGRGEHGSTIDQLTSHVSRLTTICIGPNTAKTAQGFGLSPIVPEEQTLAGIIHALESEFATLSKGLAS